VRLLLEFAPQVGRVDVPDPYYGASNGFEQVLDLVEEAAAGVLAHLRSTPAPAPPPSSDPPA
jgi:protein-tyrosine phosphatase